MPAATLGRVIQHLRKAVVGHDGTGPTDGQLLECYLAGRDEGAFEGLLRRHGPMVLSVCRRILGNAADAEDAFQATFLVLVRKASSISPREMIGNWLYGVAYRTSMKAKVMNAKRRTKERRAKDLPRTAVSEEEVWQELQPLLDQELNRLPDKYRVPVVLCELEGRPRQEVARQLGWPPGTLSCRLARAKALLAKRLARHHLALVGGALGVMLSRSAAASALPVPLFQSTIKAATRVAASQVAASGVISTEVAALTEGVLKTMLLSKLLNHASFAMTALLVVGAAGLGVSHLAYSNQPGEQPSAHFVGPMSEPDRKRPEAAVEPQERKPDPLEGAQGQLPPSPDNLSLLHEHLRKLHEGFPHLQAMFNHLHSKAKEVEEPLKGPLVVGQQVADFSVTDLAGKELRFSEMRQAAKRAKKGVIVLSFWCSFCGSCRLVEDNLDRLAKDYQDEATVIALDASAGETAEKVSAYVKKKGLTLPIVLDPTGATADLFGTKVTTTTVVIDGDGVVRYCGRFSDGKLVYTEEALKAVLAGAEVPVKTTPHDGCRIPRK
jgi:RNA polymerase sigma factor (sigma-70 family)